MARRTTDDDLARHVERWRRNEPLRPRERPRPGPGQESVWDYPRPPRLEPTGHRIRVVFAGVVVAETTRALRMLETSHPPTYYLPPDDVRTDLLERSPRRGSFCEWKGAATYWSVRVGDRFAVDAAWGYSDPFDEYTALRDHVAFYAAAMDESRVGEQIATPQPGGFYGGWVTPDLVGPFKGEPGTEGW